MIKPGDLVPVWWSEAGCQETEVLAVKPYNGNYHDLFNCVLVLKVSKTKRGWMEMAYRDPSRPTITRE